MDVYEIVTNRIIKSLEAGVVPWRKPWSSSTGRPCNYLTRKPYQGVNVWLTASAGYSSPFWLSFKQVSDLGGKVLKGEKGTPIVRYSKYTKTDADGNERELFFIRYSTVFNVAQTSGLDIEQLGEHVPNVNADAIVANYHGPAIVHGHDRAFYSPARDQISLPAPSNFNSPDAYYSTLFHELVHSTGHSSRLNRLSDTAFFGSEQYSKEELVAELGAAFLCAEAGISNEETQSASYINEWLKVLKSDRRLIVSASSQAQKACSLILGLSVTERHGGDEE